MTTLELPTLSAAMELSGPRGMCFHRSIALCLDLPSSWLIVAKLRAATPEEQKRIPNASPVPFFHSWVELNDVIYAPTTIEVMGGLKPMPRNDYYTLNGVSDVRYLSHKKVKTKIADRLILNHLNFGTPIPPGYLVEKLFEAAQLKYKVSEQGGVIPC